MEESFSQRKRAIESSSELFDEQLKKVCDDRPQLCEERYNLLVAEWESVLLKSYEDYKKRQSAIRARLGIFYIFYLVLIKSGAFHYLKFLKI